MGMRGRMRLLRVSGVLIFVGVYGRKGGELGTDMDRDGSFEE